VKVRNVHILTKNGHQSAHALGLEIQAWLRHRGISASVYPNADYSLAASVDRPDLILVLGGDGTMLSVAHQLNDFSVPLLGFNLGRVGFLTELSIENWAESLAGVLDQDCGCSSRILLAYVLERPGRDPVSGRIINDLVVSRSGLARLLGMRLEYGGETVAELRADGLIVATPMGSTAYAVAAGGPLISPDLEVMEICPICPFLSRLKPMVLPSAGEATIRIEHPTQETYLTLDGQEGIPLYQGDVIRITQAKERLTFLIPDQNSFVCKLQHKGYI